MIVVFIVVGLLVVLVVVLIIIGLRRPQGIDDDLLLKRLEEFNQRGETVDLEKIEMSQPFMERVIYPVARGLGKFATRFTPQNALQNISRKLELAGSPARLEPTIFLALQFVCAIGFGAILTLVFFLTKSTLGAGVRILLVLLVTVLGFYFPNNYLSGRIKRRQKNVRLAMPDALDLLTICVEAGLGFDSAMQKVAEKWQSDLSLAFARVLQEVNLGKIRREALRDMADNIGITEMTSFVAAIIQSESLGVSLAKVLRIQSDQMRVKRRQRAEEEAHKAPIKMSLAMAALIFPALIIVLLTPAALKLLHSTLGGLFR
jgi:tight adherence protein C